MHEAMLKTMLPELQKGEFDAFICYSRQDLLFARELERNLERYHAPKNIAVPTRTIRV